MKFHKQENEMCAFLLLNFEGFCFGILKFQSLQFASCHFGGFTWGEIMLGVFFKIWGFQIILMEFKDPQLCSQEFKGLFKKIKMNLNLLSHFVYII